MALTLAAPAFASEHPALDAVHTQVRLTQAENRADHRPVARYYWGPDRAVCDRACRWHAASRWHARLVVAVRQRPLPPPTPWTAAWYQAAMCVHSYEGAWTANTGNGYYGGLQMDMSFQAAYGPEFLAQYGTADRWPPSAQLTAAYRAWQVRGWSPWPNTAAMCGLL